MAGYLLDRPLINLNISASAPCFPMLERRNLGITGVSGLLKMPQLVTPEASSDFS